LVFQGTGTGFSVGFGTWSFSGLLDKFKTKVMAVTIL